MQDFREMSSTLTFGEPPGERNFQVRLFTFSSGSRVRWRLADAYTALGLTSCQKRSYTWCAKRAKTWAGLADSMGLPTSHFRRPVGDGPRATAFHVASTPLFLAIVCRSTTEHRSTGGAESERDRVAWGFLLSGIVAGLLRRSASFDVVVYAAPEKWQPPADFGGRAPLLVQVRDGKVDCYSFRRSVSEVLAMQAQADSEVDAWAQGLPDEPMGLALFLTRAVSLRQNVSRWFWSQLVVRLSLRFEEALLHEAEGNLESGGAPEAEGVLALFTDGGGDRECDQLQRCAKYLLATRELGAQVASLHVSFDKTTVGMKRQLCMVATQGDVGFYLPPQGLRQFVGFKRLGQRVSLNRFFGALQRYRIDFRKGWHNMLLALLYWAISEGKFKVSAVTGQVSAKMGKDGQNDQVSMVAGDAALNKLRASCSNTLELAVVYFADEENCVAWKVIDIPSRSLSDWHTEHNKALRSSGVTVTWWRAQLAGDFFHSLRCGFGMLSHPRALAQMGLTIVPSKWELTLELHHPWVAVQDERASFAFEWTLNHTGRRIVRNLWWLRGWPCRFVLMSSESEVDQRMILQELSADFRRYEKLATYAGMGTADAMLERSVFKTLVVRQLVHICKDARWQPDPRLKEFVLRNFAGIISSQATEDGFHDMRFEESKGTNKRMSHMRRFDALTQVDGLHTRHQYKRPDWKSMAVPNGSKIPPEVFEHKKKSASMDFGRIASYRDKPAWFSPGVQNLSVPVVDLAFAEYLDTTNQWDNMDQVWLTALLDCPKILVKDPKVPGSTWYLPLRRCGSMGAVSWPVVLVGEVGEETCFRLDPSPDIRRVNFSFVLTEEGYEARPMTFRSPLGGIKQGLLDRQTYTSRDAKILCKAGPPQSLLKVNACTAFENVEKAVLLKLSGLLQVDVQPSATLYGLVFALVKHSLETDDMETIKVLEVRTWKPPKCQNALEVEEAEELFDKTERQEVAKTKDRIKSEVDDFKRFTAAHAEKKKVVIAAAKAAAGKAKAKAKPKAKAGARSGGGDPLAPRALPAGVLTQEQVKKFCPPGSYVWRSSRGSWQQHTPPFPRTSAAWLKFGEREAAVRVLQDAWRCYLGEEGLGECPIHGLFAEGAPALFGAAAAPRAPASVVSRDSA